MSQGLKGKVHVHIWQKITTYEVQNNSIPSWGQEQLYLIAVQTCNTL